jgi:hypothetical protein
MRRTAAVLWLVLASVPGTLPAAAPPPRRPAPAPELRKLRVLLALDTNSDLRRQLIVDARRLQQTLRDHIPASRLEITTLKDDKVTRDAILAHYAGLAVKPDEGLLFFYGGHGALDPKTKEHSFQLQQGKPLLRREVRKAIEDRKPGLVVLLSDCCSTSLTASGSTERAIPVPHLPDSITPLLRDLFFRSRGVVDVNSAAPGSPAWGDDAWGGLFTRSLCGMLNKKPTELDANKDGFVSWDEFLPRLQADTTKLFGSWSKDMRARGETITTRTQKPHVFALAFHPVAGGGSSFAVVSLRNETTKPLKYRYRWGDANDWDAGEVPAGGKKCLTRPVPPGRAALELEFQIEGSKRTAKLQSNRWVGTGEPGFEHGRLYVWRPRKK